MKTSSTWLVLLTTGVCGVATREVLHTASVDHNWEGHLVTPMNNYNGWVNPQDLTPMPQCIAQQDQSTWLSTMTKCTSKRCTSHFGVICTHHQWLTELNCLSIEFSPDIIKGYLPYCSRSVLAKAQLYMWIRTVTGRTWLVDVGDANGLQNLSPASLTKGYADVDVTYIAPTCLAGSVSSVSMEPFQHVMASCSFTSTTQHTGNAARPWEYSESLRSMIALDFETVGYNLTQRSIRYGNYFDKECFCGSFAIDTEREPCSGREQLDLTRERLWINATCGPTALPHNWMHRLKITKIAYIPIEDWHWPACVADLPKPMIDLTEQCTTDACGLDSSGYCKVKRAVDRACFCRKISYDSCGSSCQLFETRIDYVKWLHDLCGNVQDWHGLPNNWRPLAAPTPLDMIPWRWTIKPSNGSNIAPIIPLGSIKATETCASNEWKLRSFVLVNIATCLATFFSRRTGIYRIARGLLWYPHPWGWFTTGICIAILQLLANWLNASLVQNTLGYENVPVIQLMLLWCSMPRLAWLPILLIGVQPFEAINFSAAVSSLFAEIILQVFSSYYMVMTVNYGREHNFYLGGMKGAERERPATIMYIGALLWLAIICMVLVQLLLAARRMVGSGSLDLVEWQRNKQPTSTIAEELMAQLNERCIWLREQLEDCLIDKSRDPEEASLTNSEGRNHTAYGTFPVRDQSNWVFEQTFLNLYVVTAMGLLLLWIAQWLFWGGFIGLSSEEFCPPELGALTAVWITFSSVGVVVGAP